MKKLDKLILGSFLGPFLLTFIVVDFILLTVNMLKYFDEIFGKDLPFMVYLELIGYFVISISPMALPLAVLLSSLMTFGNLGEHFELTAIKSSGISLLRAMLPIGIFVVFLTVFAYLSNNYVVPRVNLKTFSLLYDIRMKSPALDIKEGVFYNGIPSYSIKVNRKLDEVRLQEVLIYDHTQGQGNLHVITADSGRMEPFFNDRYMMLTLYNGNSYQEGTGQRGARDNPVTFSRTKFDKNEMVFSLDAFDLKRTPENLWSNSKSIKNIGEIRVDLDSMDRELNHWYFFNYANTEASYNYFGRNRKLMPPKEIVDKKNESDSLKNLKYKDEYENPENGVRVSENQSRQDRVSQGEVPVGAPSDSTLGASGENSQVAPKRNVAGDTSGQESGKNLAAAKGGVRDAEVREARDSINELATQPDMGKINRNAALKSEAPEPARLTAEQQQRLDSIRDTPRYRTSEATVGLTAARNIKNNFTTNRSRIEEVQRNYRAFKVAWYQKYTQSIACFVMFMIGAPLGAIIKKGGLGMPVLMSIIFFIMYYMLTISGEKWAKEGMSDTFFGTFFSNLALLPFGLFFLRQARKDARLFEPDFYQGIWDKAKKHLMRKPATGKVNNERDKKLKEEVL
ncbi:lipopolysaccharide export system permease protein [Cyclobacterium lianum]|uniref:Lipopolysaccharide export system permease protein n=1 Tax=Cyclobacterium lianum TaxID=388280 RepID=A0A1M7Q624_9BACT|nr:LptF/LptG family permease [Cyclobacterium lianum]SHN25809.1 lipopolysaccharide export system permease protein [Cyclobacterium lianum]